jgi:class 3 adenylate cyclase/tetratricopeptide (TPR) repeat protein
MICSSCGEENRDTAKFCVGCGQSLAILCSGCGAELPAAARFCDQCGAPQQVSAVGTQSSGPDPQHPTPDPRSYTPTHLAAKILTARSALEGERKQVTVLFADISGFTALSERLDPEDIHGIMDRCFRILSDEVHRYEGTINQYTGDGIMALFGAPIAHEDAPERAVRAALGIHASLKPLGDELRAQRGIDFQMRIGINSGPVVVGKVGDDLRMDYTAVGDTTNLAARLQAAAPPGGILISEATAKFLAGRFATEPVGPLQLKGKSRPVTAHTVVRALPRPPLVTPSEHGLTPLIGRTTELAALETLFNHARAGRGQIAFVVGEAGIGKSRVIHEFRRRLGDQELTWLQGRCISFGRGIPFLPVIEVVKNAFGIDEGDDERTLIMKVAQGIEPLGPEAKAAEVNLRMLLAVDPGDPDITAMDASARRFATFEALKRLMLSSAARQPLIVLIEDLHWIDPASEEYLTYIADAVVGAPILLLCTHRPGYRAALGDRSFITRLALQPLSRDETAAMTTSMLGAQELPAEIRTLIASKAEGNPFFIEEVTKSLIEVGALRRTPTGFTFARPVSEIVIPNTIQDVIMARIDRLGDEPKRAIQIASVIGREFAVRLLQRASELGERVTPLVGELRALELIYEKSGVPELAYMFKHALTHDVAYESLLVQRRKMLHHTIGRAIEELYADRLPEHWETLSHHFYRAEDWPRAFRYLMTAGDKARAAFANSEALTFYDRALEAAAHLQIEPGLRAAILEGKGRAHLCISEFPQAIEALRTALGLVSAPEDRARLNAILAEALLWAHEFDLAIAAATEAVATAESCGVERVVGDANYVLAFVAALRGEVERIEQFHVRASRIARSSGAVVLRERLGLLHALRNNWRGKYADAIEEFEQLLPELRRVNELLSLVEGYSHFAITLGGAGEYADMLEVTTDGIALAHSIGDKVWRARLWNTRGWVLAELGAYDAAEEANRRSIEVMKELGSVRFASEFVGNATINLADAALWHGNLSRAEPFLAEVAALLADRRNEWMTWRYGMHYDLTAAEFWIARSDLARARQHIANCMAVAQRTRSRRYVVRAQRLLAACHVAGGNLPEGERLLSEVVSQARTLSNPTQLWQALLGHGQVLHALGRHDEARGAARDGLDLANRVASTLAPELQSVFRSSTVLTGLEECNQ